jgi:hypothetical protein
MSSSLDLEEQMYFFKKEENQHLDKLKETQKKSRSMSDAIDELIAFCNIQIAKEELAEKMTKELAKELAQEELAKELAQDELAKELAQEELDKDELV